MKIMYSSLVAHQGQNLLSMIALFALVTIVYLKLILRSFGLEQQL